MGSVIVKARAAALATPSGPQREVLIGLHRGFISTVDVPAFAKRRELGQLPATPEELGSPSCSNGVTAGNILGGVMVQLQAEFRHEELRDYSVLFKYAVSYGWVLGIPVDGATVLEWITSSERLMRAHCASAADAEFRGVAVGERLELEFLRALAKRTKVQMAADEPERIRQRRADLPNLPSGVSFTELPTAAVGGPLDGAFEVSPAGATTLRAILRTIQAKILLDLKEDGALFDRGRLAGVTASDPVPVIRSEKTDPAFHAGRLFGSLEASMVRHRGDRKGLEAAIGVYTAALGSSQVQEALTGEARSKAALFADAYARYRIRSRGLSQPDADALAFFGWLTEQLGLQLTPKLLEQREHAVLRIQPNSGDSEAAP